MLGIALLLGMFHLGTSDTVQVNICGVPTAPIISNPTTTVTTATQALPVEGTATPNTIVSLLDNNNLSASLLSDGSGNFGGTVQLVAGANSIVAQVGNTCNQTATSSVVSATYTPPPPPPPPKKPVVVTSPPAVVAVSPANNTPATYIPIVTAPTDTLSGKGLKLQITSTSTAAPTTQTPKTITTTADSVYVSGTTGVAANVALVVNGKVVADLVSDGSGDFRALVPLSIGKNKIQVIATLGNKEVVRNLSYQRTSAVAAIGTGIVITYIGASIIILIFVGLIARIMWVKHKKRRDEQERIREHAPVNL